MRTSVRTIMKARAQQKLNAVRVQGFKCQEIGYKRYTNMKQILRTIISTIEKLENEEIPKNSLIDKWYKHKEVLKKAVSEYEKKHNINEKPKKPVREKKQGLMSKVRSLFNRGKR